MGAIPLILFGGLGSEHQVSVASAQNIVSSIQAEPWFWGQDGLLQRCSLEHLQSFENPFTENFVLDDGVAASPKLEFDSFLDHLNAERCVILALHGGEGENGVIQQALEACHIPFTASGSVSSALAFDKWQAREVAEQHGIPVAAGCVLSHSLTEYKRQIINMLERYPGVVLKPTADGSSIGLHFLKSGQSIESVLETLSKTTQSYLCEEWIEGRELTVGVIERPDDRQGSSLEALPVGEAVVDAGRSFDFSGKYLGDGVQELVPAPISAAQSKAAQELALRIHQKLGCQGYTRSDFMLRSDGTVVFLECNTLPGVTAPSWIPQQLKAAGIAFDRFWEEQIELAHRRVRKNT